MKSSLALAGIQVEPGQAHSTVVELSLAGVSTKMPLFVLNGAAPGPTVVITAGIHGAEYVGIEAAYRLARHTSPAEIHGQLVVAPIASMTAFAKRAIYICPPDDKNLNRQFPGDPHGSFSQQLAAWIFHNLIHAADIYLDLHGGDMNEALVPFSIIRQTGNTDLDAKALALAEAFGLRNILTSVAPGSTPSAATGAPGSRASVVPGSTYAAAAEIGIPAVLVEVGGQGLWPEHHIQAMSAGLERALAHVGLLRRPTQPIPQPTRLLKEMVWLRSAFDGLFYPLVSVTDEVQAGQLLGRLTDYLGNPLEEVVAPVSGPLLFLVTTLAMNNGDPLLAIGRL